MNKQELKQLHMLYLVRLDAKEFVDWVESDKGEATLVLLNLPPGSKEVLESFPEACKDCPEKEAGCERSDNLANVFLTEVFKKGLSTLAIEGMVDLLKTLKGEIHDLPKGTLGEAKGECDKRNEGNMAENPKG